ncbi:MAG: Holliday junction resolvase RuvX [Elusimicrobiota bacterium]
MSILAIDYGKKRLGFAVTTSSFIPTPLPPVTVEKTDTVFSKIVEIVEEFSVSEIVIGLPINMNGSENEMTKEIRKFACKIYKKIGLKAVFVNEQLTSKEANEKLADTQRNWRKRKQKMDSAAACLILQNYVEQKKTGL